MPDNALNCNPITGAINLNPNCDALTKKGGIDKQIWIGAVSQLLSYTLNPDGSLATIVLKDGENLISARGKRYKNSTTMGNTQTENGALFQHGVTFIAFLDTQVEKETIEKLAGADDLFTFSKLNAGKFEAHGLVAKNGNLADGMKMTASGGSGTAAGDASSLTLTFAGEEDKLPVYAFLGSPTASDADNIAYLEALVTADAVEEPAAAAA